MIRIKELSSRIIRTKPGTKVIGESIAECTRMAVDFKSSRVVVATNKPDCSNDAGFEVWHQEIATDYRLDSSMVEVRLGFTEPFTSE